jgi:hypothetical protein
MLADDFTPGRPRHDSNCESDSAALLRTSKQVAGNLSAKMF